MAAAVEYHGLSREAQFSAEIRLIFSPEATRSCNSIYQLKQQKNLVIRDWNETLFVNGKYILARVGEIFQGRFCGLSAKGGGGRPQFRNVLGGTKTSKGEGYPPCEHRFDSLNNWDKSQSDKY